jgi:hypothetical protein
MQKINWTQKLSSRKFWAALATWVGSMCTAFNLTDQTTARITILLGGIGAMVVYILAESYVDSKRTPELPAVGGNQK